MLEIFLTFVGTTLFVLVVVWFIGIALGWKHKQEAVQKNYDVLLNQALSTQALRTASETELQFLKSSLAEYQKRPIQAMLNEDQFRYLMGSIEARMNFHDKSMDEKRRPN